MYAVVLMQNELYMFMEYCNEGTLWSIAQQGLPEAMVRHYTRDLLQAVFALHDRGIIHRDIKGFTKRYLYCTASRVQICNWCGVWNNSVLNWHVHPSLQAYLGLRHSITFLCLILSFRSEHLPLLKWLHQIGWLWPQCSAEELQQNTTQWDQAPSWNCP